MSRNMKSKRTKKEWKGLRRLGKNIRDSRGKKKPDGNLDLSMALFQVAFLEECLIIFLEECLEWQECLGSMKSQ